jgi:hypothetical protein
VRIQQCAMIGASFTLKVLPYRFLVGPYQQYFSLHRRQRLYRIRLLIWPSPIVAVNRRAAFVHTTCLAFYLSAIRIYLGFVTADENQVNAGRPPRCSHQGLMCSPHRIVVDHRAAVFWCSQRMLHSLHFLLSALLPCRAYVFSFLCSSSGKKESLGGTPPTFSAYARHC